MNGPHPSHVTRNSDSSDSSVMCVNCGAHDDVPGGWGDLVYPCPKAKWEKCDLCKKMTKDTRLCIIAFVLGSGSAGVIRRVCEKCLEDDPKVC